MFTYKFLGLDQADAESPYFYGSLPAKPHLGTLLTFDTTTGNRYVVFAIEGEGLTGKSDRDDQKELAWAEISRGEKVPILFVQRIHDAPPTIVQG